jgi:hypothetical protein
MLALLAAAFAMANIVPAPKIPWPLGIYSGRISSSAAHRREEPERDHHMPTICCPDKPFTQEATLMVSSEHLTFSATQRVYSGSDVCAGPYVERSYTTLARIDSFDPATGILRVKTWNQHEKKHEVQCFYTEVVCPSPSFFGLNVQPCKLILVEVGGRSPDFSQEKRCDPATHESVLASREPAWHSKPWCRKEQPTSEKAMKNEVGRLLGAALKGSVRKAEVPALSSHELHDERKENDGDTEGVWEYSRVWHLTLTTPLERGSGRSGAEVGGKKEEKNSNPLGSAGLEGGGNFLIRLLRRMFP